MSTFTPNMGRCMGNSAIEAICQKCARLPRTESEENHKYWIKRPETYLNGAFCSRFVVTAASYFSDVAESTRDE